MSVSKPVITWFPAAAGNVLARPAGIKYEAIVWHTTAGGRTVADLGHWFGGENLRQGHRGSTHFGVDLAGNCGQYVSLASMAIAHGQEAGATARLARENSATANAWAIGIEHLDGGQPGQWTVAQVEASAWLTAWLWETEIVPHAAITGARLDRDHILGHFELAPASRPHCPSRSPEQFAAQIARVAAVLAEAPGPPRPDSGHARVRALEDALTVQATALDDLAARATIQAQNLRRVLTEG